MSVKAVVFFKSFSVARRVRVQVQGGLGSED